MTGGLSPTTTAAPPSLIESVIRDDLAVAGGGSRGQTYADTKKSGRTATKNRSLLDMDIPPPDRDTMRRYAIVLNSCELTKRHSNSRSGSESCYLFKRKRMFGLASRSVGLSRVHTRQRPQRQP